MKLIVISEYLCCRLGLTSILEDVDPIATVVAIESIDQLIELKEEIGKIDVVLFDTQAQPGDPVAAVARLQVVVGTGGTGGTGAVIVVHGQDGAGVVRQHLEAGVAGVVFKETEAPVLVNAVRLVLSGGRYVPESVLSPVRQEKPELKVLQTARSVYEIVQKPRSLRIEQALCCLKNLRNAKRPIRLRLVWPSGLLLACLSFPAWAAAPGACDLDAGESAQVVSIVDGDTVGLADGREVRLVGLQAPKLGAGRAQFVDWPLAEEAQRRLASLVLNARVQLSYGGARRDRYDRLLAHLHLDDGHWVQARMIVAGLARVYSFSDNTACIRALLAFEGDARRDRRGIWALDHYAPRKADNIVQLLQLENSYQLVEGRVREVGIVRGRGFINFGEDWHQDFTISIGPRDLRRFRDGLDIYAGASVRVRGWLKSYNGPGMVVTHPEQIELLPVNEPPS